MTDQQEVGPKKSPSPRQEHYAPVARKGMRFGEAFAALLDGEKVTRLEWGNPDLYCSHVGGFICTRLDDGLDHPWIISDGDIAATDWIIVT